MATKRTTTKKPSIRGTLLARGYFPKELPPFFFTSDFARYASTPSGKKALDSYKPTLSSTDCVSYHLALPGGEHRHLQIPHPHGFNKLAAIVAKAFPRLLTKGAKSAASRSRAVYGQASFRALHAMTLPANQRRERALTRAGASFVLNVDISQFYPSLYTHAVGWAIDPKLRLKANWRNTKFLGKQIDQALMDMQGKVSQGIPIGNDVSYLLAEVVLGQVDRALGLDRQRCYRWFDDYELSFDTRDDAERCLARLKKELHRFRLRVNAKKTSIVQLPEATEPHWGDTLRALASQNLKSQRGTLQYFDTAFRLREDFPNQPVLMYAIGNLFRTPRPPDYLGRIAEAAISQALLCEPGVAQKAFALLTYWKLNGYALDMALLTRTIERVILRHDASGVTSDVAWALCFCAQEKLVIPSKASRILAESDDDCVLLLALHLDALKLLQGGLSARKVAPLLKSADPDGDHWLLAYEAARHGFQPASPAVTGNPLLADLLKHKVSFLRRTLPSYALIVHQGGAPDWVVKSWINTALRTPPKGAPAPAVETFLKDLAGFLAPGASAEDAILELLDVGNTRGVEQDAADDSIY